MEEKEVTLCSCVCVGVCMCVQRQVWIGGGLQSFPPP